MAGVKGKSGRKKSNIRTLKDALTKLEGDLPSIVEKLKSLAFGRKVECPFCHKELPILKPDREAAIYLIDRIMGRPKQIAETNITQTIQLKADDCFMLMELAAQRAAEFKALPQKTVEAEFKEIATS